MEDMRQRLIETNPLLALQILNDEAEPCPERDEWDRLLAQQSAPNSYRYLSWPELKKILGVTKVMPEDALNVCLGLQSTPGYKSLSEEERVRALRSATNAMEWMMAGVLPKE